jgi:hypothetical protein
MKKNILNIMMMLLTMAAFLSCSKEMPGGIHGDTMENLDIRSIIITGAVTDAHNGQVLEDITIHFEAYHQNATDASPLIIDQVHTTSLGTYTINVSGDFNEPVLCILRSHDTRNIYASKTNHVNISWGGTSYDRKTGTFVVNDCNFQLNRAE